LSSACIIAERPTKPTAIRVLHKVFSFPVVLASFLAVLAVLTVRSRFNDPDMWWHLKSGEVIWNTRHIPTTDTFSYTTHHHWIIPQEWLSQLLIYGAYRLGGFSGLMLWSCALTTILLVAGYLLCSLYSGNAKIGFLGAMILWFFSTGGLVVRPQMVSYVLLVVELLLVFRGYTRDRRWFFVMPVLFAVWVNCHASFLFGLIVLGVFWTCSFFDFQAGSVACVRWTAAQRRALGVALLFSGAAVFLNPIGAKQVLYPLDTMLRQRLNLSQVQEWSPLLPSDPRGIALLGIFCFLFFYLLARRSERLYLHELVLLGMSAWFALSHRRMSFAFGIFAAPVVSRLLSDFWEKYDAERDLPLLNAVFLAVAAFVMFLAFPSSRALARQASDANPAAAVDYIKTHKLPGNMLNSYVYGGYLIWAMPEHPVFIDGRADLYEWAGVLTEFGRWATLEDDPNALLDKYDVGFCLLERDAPMAHVLPLTHEWKRVYLDDKSVIFVRTTVGVPSDQ
jgi:hypothetical protein